MRKLAAGLLAALFASALGTPAFAKTETITGRLVDMICYTADHKRIGNAHEGMSETCAQDCAKKGQPPALVTDDGKVYHIIGDVTTGNNAKLVPHMSHKMEITGEVMVWKNGHVTISAADIKMLEK